MEVLLKCATRTKAGFQQEPPFPGGFPRRVFALVLLGLLWAILRKCRLRSRFQRYCQVTCDCNTLNTPSSEFLTSITELCGQAGWWRIQVPLYQPSLSRRKVASHSLLLGESYSLTTKNEQDEQGVQLNTDGGAKGSCSAYNLPTGGRCYSAPTDCCPVTPLALCGQVIHFQRSQKS